MTMTGRRIVTRQKQTDLSCDELRALIADMSAIGLDCRDLIREFEARFPGEPISTEPKRSPGNPVYRPAKGKKPK